MDVVTAVTRQSLDGALNPSPTPIRYAYTQVWGCNNACCKRLLAHLFRLASLSTRNNNDSNNSSSSKYTLIILMKRKK